MFQVRPSSPNIGSILQKIYSRVSLPTLFARRGLVSDVAKGKKLAQNAKEARRLTRLQRKVNTVVYLPDFVTPRQLSNLLGVRTVDILKLLIKLGVPPESSEQFLDNEIVDLILQEYKRIPVREQQYHRDRFPRSKDYDPETYATFPPRPPVVAIMGHIDHGKTTLLDRLRGSNVASSEPGQITQHIDAYVVKLKKTGSTITVLDTPGHEAFIKMRKRGASITDIALLVVAGDEGVKEQTIEALKHIQQNEIPYIVVITKVDKRNVDLQKVKLQLNNIGVSLEEFGGDVPVVPVSALQGTNIDRLEEVIMMQAEMLDLRADPSGPAEMAVIDSKKEPKKGIAIKGLVQAGTLKRKDPFVVGETFGTVRWIFDHTGKAVDSAVPGFVYEIYGVESPPEPGDILLVVESEHVAREVASYRKSLRAEKEMQQHLVQERKLLSRDSATQNAPPKPMTTKDSVEPNLKQRFVLFEAPEIKEIPIIIKGDVAGSVEAIKEAINQIPQKEIKLRVVRTGIGAITESDVEMASVTEPKAIIMGFNVPLPTRVSGMADKEGVSVHSAPVIFSLMDWLRGVIEKHLPPKEEVETLGTAVVKQVFPFKIGKGKFYNVAGCFVEKGSITRGDTVQIFRKNDLLYEGPIHSIRHFKDNVKTVRTGQECGISFGKTFTLDIQPDDVIVAIKRKQIHRTLEEQQAPDRKSVV